MCHIKEFTCHLEESTCYLKESTLAFFVNPVKSISSRDKIKTKKNMYDEIDTEKLRTTLKLKININDTKNMFVFILFIIP